MPIARLLVTRATWLACSVVLATLAACGGGDDDAPAPGPDPLTAYREQTVNWTECDPSILGMRDAVTEQWWAAAGERLQCAQVRAPMDWSHPDRGDVSLAVMRLAAGDPARRRGAIFFNPGGPGGDGLFLTFSLMLAFADSNPATVQGAQQLRLLAEYDAVGFSPRGVGASTRLQCATNEHERIIDASPAGLTDANLADRAYNARKKTEACQKSPLAAHIHTEATARDLDLLRGLLHDDRLNYVGTSYGTWLGAWYAGLFPDRVGRMVLDSSMDFSATFERALVEQQVASQYAFDHLVAAYAARHAAEFGLGDTPEAVRAAAATLSQPVQDLLAQELNLGGNIRITDALRRPGDVDIGLIGLRAAQAFDAVLASVADPSDAAALQAAIDATGFDRDAVLRPWVNALHRRYQQRWVQRQTRSVALSNSDSVYTAVMCNDTPVLSTAAEWSALGRSLALRAPLYFSEALDFPCTAWGGPVVVKPAMATLAAQPLLFVQSEFDTLTDTAGADHFFAQMPQSRRVFVRADFQHGIFPYDDDCVDPVVTAFLLGEPPAARETTCPGHALPQDRWAAARSARQEASATESRYLHPEQARQLISAYKRGVRR